MNADKKAPGNNFAATLVARPLSAMPPALPMGCCLQGLWGSQSWLQAVCQAAFSGFRRVFMPPKSRQKAGRGQDCPRHDLCGYPAVDKVSGEASQPNVTYFSGKAGFRVNCGADPLGGALWATGRPRPALASWNQTLTTIEEPAWGPAGPGGTPEGVRPTDYAGTPPIGKVSDIGLPARGVTSAQTHPGGSERPPAKRSTWVLPNYICS